MDNQAFKSEINTSGSISRPLMPRSVVWQQPRTQVQNRPRQIQHTRPNLIDLHPVIENVDHLKQIVLSYGQFVYKERPVSKDLLNCIVDGFIDKKLFSSGNIFATDKSILPGHPNKQAVELKKQQLEFFSTFWPLFYANYEDTNITDPADLPVMGEGTYGAVFRYEESSNGKPGKIMKFIKEGYGIYTIDISYPTHELFVWMIELCTYIITASLLIFIDCLSVDDDIVRATCLIEGYKDVYEIPIQAQHKDTDLFNDPYMMQKTFTVTSKSYFIGYFAFFANTVRPFVNKIYDTIYVLGYIMDEHDTTVQDMYSKPMTIQNDTTNQQNLIDAFNVTTQIVEIFRRFTYLSNIGINISHRDTTPKNIMTIADTHYKNRFKVKLIDFGFLCANIKCRSGETVYFGYHAFKNKHSLNMCNKKEIDIVLFLTWVLRYNASFLNALKLNTGVDVHSILQNIITLDNPELQKKITQQQYGNYTYSPWEYSASIKSTIKSSSTSVSAPTTTVTSNTPQANSEIDAKTVSNIFKRLFELLKTLRVQLKTIKNYARTSGVEITDYGNIKTYNLSDRIVSGDLNKFYDLYQKNKRLYLNLDELEQQP